MSWLRDGHGLPRRPEFSPTSVRNLAKLEKLHDAYSTFCEYGWHHITWKNLAFSLRTYLGADSPSDPNGQLQQLRPNAARLEYLTQLNIEAFGYLTKDVLLVLFRSAGFIQSDASALAYHRPFQRPAWQYLSRLPQDDLQSLQIDIANSLQERTSFFPRFTLIHSVFFSTPTAFSHSVIPCTERARSILHDSSSHARIGNILNLAPDWRPTFGAEYGIFQFLEVKLSSKDASTLRQLQIENTAVVKATYYERPTKRLRRALSVRAAPSKSNVHPEERREENSGQIRKRFSWPLPDNYRRLFKPQSRRRKTESTTDPDPSTASSTVMPAPASTALAVKTPEPKESKISMSAFEQFMEEQRTSLDGPKKPCPADAESVRSSHTLDSLLDFYSQNLLSQVPKLVLSNNASATALEVPRPDSPILLAHSPVVYENASGAVSEVLRPDSPGLVSFSPVSISRKSSLSAPRHRPQRDMSPSSGHLSFVTARTVVSPRAESRLTRRSSKDSFRSFDTMSSLNLKLPASSAYFKLLKSHDLVPQPEIETNWSGRGQHAEFSQAERQNIPLQTEKLLGRTRTALVESVRCKRVRLVRKTIRCTRGTGVKLEDALREVQHLDRARHAHIVRLVGTYSIGTNLAILTYPCAEWNLEQFMDLTRNTHDTKAKCASLLQFFTCSAKLLDFLHSFPIKHMDIKPQNLLVRDTSNSVVKTSNQYKLYFTDFGISRSYASIDDCETETPTSFTRAYAALEVVTQQSRGLSADIFSLGCVYAEMLATILDSEPQTKVNKIHWATLRAARQGQEGDVRPYYCAVDELQAWLSKLPVAELEVLAVRNWITAMVNNDSGTRPTARQIADDPRLPFACMSCNMRSGPEDFEAAEPLTLTPPQDSPQSLKRPARTIMEVPVLA